MDNLRLSPLNTCHFDRSVAERRNLQSRDARNNHRSLRFAARYLCRAKLQVSPLRYAPVEMTNPLKMPEKPVRRYGPV